MTREEQIKKYISTYIEQYAESVDCNPKEVEHLGNFIRVGINWADRHPKDEINWQQVRIQAAIAAMQAILSSKTMMEVVNETVKIGELHGKEVSADSAVSNISVGFANALVKELKGE